MQVVEVIKSKTRFEFRFIFPTRLRQELKARPGTVSGCISAEKLLSVWHARMDACASGRILIAGSLNAQPLAATRDKLVCRRDAIAKGDQIHAINTNGSIRQSDHLLDRLR